MTRFLLLGLLGLAACGDQKVDTEDTDETEETDAPGYTIEVAAQGETAEVDLSDVSTSDLDGEQVVMIGDVLTASGLTATWADLSYDFEASDGYRPSVKGCGPVDYDTVLQAGLHPETGNLTWAESLGLEGCFYVDGVVLVDAIAPE